MHKIISIFKNYITVILISIVVVLAIASASADAPSKMTICQEIGQGNYQHLNQLLEPNTSLRDIKLNNKGEPIYTAQQSLELATINTVCLFRITPFTALIPLLGESLANSYTKLFKS
jgi:hypothetical protein